LEPVSPFPRVSRALLGRLIDALIVSASTVRAVGPPAQHLGPSFDALARVSRALQLSVLARAGLLPLFFSMCDA
jgi:hypothetical protein